VALERWLATFPSYGFLLSVGDANLEPVLERFAARGIACAAIGRIDGSRKVTIARGAERAVLWDLGSEALIGCAPAVQEVAA
jgi:selenophosphate synthetase-related protein